MNKIKFPVRTEAQMQAMGMVEWLQYLDEIMAACEQAMQSSVTTITRMSFDHQLLCAAMLEVLQADSLDAAKDAVCRAGDQLSGRAPGRMQA